MLENRSPVGPLLASRVFDQPAYAGILVDFEEVFAALEPVSERFLASFATLWSADQPYTSRLLNRRSLARRDLAALGPPPRPVRAALADLADSLSQSPPDQLWGLSYVLLGQMMGAGQISLGLNKCHGFDPTVIPTAFFCDHIRTGIALWRGFLAHLNASNAQPQEALRGAVRAFEAFLLVWPARTSGQHADLRPTA